MNKSAQLGARIAAAGLAGAAVGTLVGAIGFMLGEEWFGSSLFFFQPTPRLGGLVGTCLIGVLGCAVGLVVGLLGGRFLIVNATLGGAVGLAVTLYEVVANASRFTGYDLTISLTAVVGCLLAGLVGGELSRRLADHDKIPPATTQGPNRT